MAGSDQVGQLRVREREMNNRNTPMAKGEETKTPRKAGAQQGFASNPTQDGGVFRGLKSGKNSALGS